MKLLKKIPLLGHKIKSCKKSNIGKVVVSTDSKKIFNTAKKNNCEILLPIDFIVTTTITKRGLVKQAHLNNIPDQHIIADIGPKTIAMFAEKIKNSKTILWNGPLGIFEIEPFNKGTYSLAKKVAKLTKENKMERTLSIIKPDATRRNLTGTINNRSNLLSLKPYFP